MPDNRSKIETSWPLMIVWVLSVLIAVGSFRFLVADMRVVMPDMLHHAFERPIHLYLHIGLAPILLLLLPVQFSKRLRQNRPEVHRFAGRLYAVLLLLAGVSGFFLALETNAGPVAAAGFGLLALVWIGVTARAVQCAVQRQIVKHREWMIRSAALTLAAVTLRIYLPVGAAFVGFDPTYVFVSWACWVPNLIFAEWYLQRRPRQQAA